MLEATSNPWIRSDKRQVAASNLRFGEGVTAEVGMDLKNMKARKVRAIPRSSPPNKLICPVRRSAFLLIPMWPSALR